MQPASVQSRRSSGTRRRLIAHRGRRPGAALIVSALSSAGNFVLTVAVARSSSVGEVGQYAIAFSVYVLVSGIIRAAVAESALAAHGVEDGFSEALGRACLLVLALAPPVALIAFALRQPYLAVAAVALPGMVIYDHIRVLQVALGRPSIAVRQELVWAFCSLLVFVGVQMQWMSPLLGFAAWATSGSILGFLTGKLLGLALRPRWSGGRTEARIAALYSLDHLAGTGTAQVNVFVIAGVGGSAVAGSLRGAATLFSPLNLIISAVRPLAIRKLAVVRRHQPTSELRTAGLATFALVGITFPLALLALLVPDEFGRALLGQTWGSAAPLMLPLGLEAVASGVAAMAFAGHRAHRAAVRTLVVRLSLAPVRIGVVLACAAAAGAVGAAWGMFAVAVLGALIWWGSYWSNVRVAGPSA
jgi:O-antigen/teichoic acid export membrane protein